MSLETAQKKSLLLGLRSGTAKGDEREGEVAAGSASQNRRKRTTPDSLRLT